jgi:hypothetical protein
MSSVTLANARLKDVDDSYYFAAECKKCRHASRLKLSALREHLGAEFKLADIRTRLRCELCGHRDAVISFLSPNQAVSNLVPLFNRPTKS